MKIAFAIFTLGIATTESHVRFIGNRIRYFHKGGMCDEGVSCAFHSKEPSYLF